LLWPSVKKHWLIPGIAAVYLWGYRFPSAGESLSPHLSWMVACIMFMMGLGIGFLRLRGRIGAWRQNLLAILVCYSVAPLLSWGVGKTFFSGQPGVYLGLMLIGTTSTTLSTCIVFTRLSGGDEALALWLSVVSSFLCAFLQPLLLNWAVGQTVTIPVGMLIQRLMLVLVAPLAAGMLLRSLLGESRVAVAGDFLTRAATVIILIVIMVAVAKGRELLGSWQALPVLAAAAGIHFALLGAAYLASRLSGFTRPDRIAITFCAAQKTLQVPAYLAINVLASPEAGLPPVLYHVFQLISDSLLIAYFSSHKG
jgi:solute carrier family 10 (sodium/bile acid cotransporter), member 7